MLFGDYLYLKSVELDLARREKSGCSCGCSLSSDDWKAVNLLWSNLSLESGLVSGQKSSLGVASIEGVDEWVDSSAVGTVWNKVGTKVSNWGILWSKGSSVEVESEVAVSWVMGIDKGVAVGIILNIVVVVDLWLSWDDRDLGVLDGYLLLNWNGFIDFGLSSIESGSLLSIGWNVGTFENPESILSSAVPHIVGLAILTNVGVLTNTVSIDVCLLTEHVSIFGGKSGSSPTVSSIEALLLEDLGILRINKLGTACSNGNTDNNLNHDLKTLILISRESGWSRGFKPGFYPVNCDSTHALGKPQTRLPKSR